ncbi:peptidyl-tRNA hydrolase [Xylariaceae sp. FL0016]|nr:peptidyl-tRNA hydrolase [Xylariaceae sp. FL0016]
MRAKLASRTYGVDTSGTDAAARATKITLTIIPTAMAHQPNATMRPLRLFIASLGNPSPLRETRHSAGHVLIKALQSHLKFPAFKKSKPYGQGLMSTGADVGRPEFTLWQSPSFMNTSGTLLVRAYQKYMREACEDGDLPGLVVLHDQMETAPGQLKVRAGDMSAKGHNGIKSVQSSLQSAGLFKQLTGPENRAKFINIGYGIGRPAGGSREKGDVSAYVLGKFTMGELDGIAKSAASLEELLEKERMRMSS